ncbi:MAG: DUF951 domain-containing protein [Thermomicrobiales bacterium]
MARRDTPLEIVVGDVVELRKTHPCGSKEWTVTGLGADIRMRCNGCSRRIMMPRRTLEKRMRRFVSRGPAMVLAEAILAGEHDGSVRPVDLPDDSEAC